MCYYRSHEGALTPKSKDYDCGGETVGVAIEAVRTLKSPSESERFTIPTKQKSATTQRVKRFFVLLIEVERFYGYHIPDVGNMPKSH